MAINLKKHQEEIITAWKDVLDDKTSTDWALFGYEGLSNDLKVISTGDGGLSELIDDLNSSKIMYAFLQVTDPQTSLQKYVLINWQGEGAPVVRKGTCAGHVGDVARLLRGAHATLHARAEEDLDADRLTKLVATGSRYDFKTPRQEPEPCKPVTSTYKRIIPSQEINSKERDSFWQNEQEKEKERFKAESQRRNLNNQQQAERIVEPKQNNEIEISTKPKENTKLTPTEEARTIIESNRSIANSRAIFENRGNAQVQKNPAPAKPLRNSLVQRSIAALAASSEPQNNHSMNYMRNTETRANNLMEIKENSAESVKENNIVVEEQQTVVTNVVENTNSELETAQTEDSQSYEENSEVEDEQYSTIKRTPHSKITEDESIRQVEDITSVDVIGQNNEDELVYQSMGADGYELYGDYSDMGLRARALYDYQAADESEITFDPGDVITHIDRIDEGWWQGLAPDGTFGLFPANYVEMIQ